MWPISLSARLPIVGTVGRYPAVYLMGREPLSLRIAPLTSLPCDSVVLCGISNRFRLLSPSKRQVAHALLTRSPLSKIPKNLTPFDLHVLGTPPAFVLSQDQTLEFNLYSAFQRWCSLFFFRLVVFLFASVILDLSIGIDLACLLMHYIVFKVLRFPFLRDSFVSISQPRLFVNTFFQLF